MLPVLPRAYEAFDLTEYDLVLSNSSSCSIGVITRAGCRTTYAIANSRTAI
jgi:hypothetical protein